MTINVNAVIFVGVRYLVDDCVCYYDGVGVAECVVYCVQFVSGITNAEYDNPVIFDVCVVVIVCNIVIVVRIVFFCRACGQQQHHQQPQQHHHHKRVTPSTQRDDIITDTLSPPQQSTE